MDLSSLSLGLGYALFPLCMGLAAVWDISTFTIPNRLCAALVLGFAAAAPLCGLSLHDIALHLAAGGGALLIGFALFAFRIIGGGDAKFLAASALWFGWPDVSAYAVGFSLAGGALVLLLLLIRNLTLPPAFLASRDWVARLYDRNSGVPYGVAFAAGGLFVYPQSELFARLTAG